MMSLKNKTDLVILDQCLDGITGLEQINFLKESKIVRLSDIGLNKNSSDEEILDKAKLIADSGEYASVTILTADKGRDNDTTFITPQKKVTIIYCSYQNIYSKLNNSGLKSLVSWNEYYIEIYDHELRTTRLPKYGKPAQTKIKNLTNKNSYTNGYTN